MQKGVRNSQLAEETIRYSNQNDFPPLRKEGHFQTLRG